jgi:phosphoglycerate dehydrogenase-like enzyme
MSKLRIFCDVRLNEAELLDLREKVAPHEVLTPTRLAHSVMAESESETALLSADIAVGQPAPSAVLAAPHLRWLQITTAGFTRYDTPEFRAGVAARQIIVSNASDVYSDACAEHVFAFMLAQSRHLPESLRDHSTPGSPEWHRLRQSCVPLRGQKVAILGYGTIAERLIEMLAPFQMEITAMRRRPRGDEAVPIVSLDGLPGILATANHVVNILPANAESDLFISTGRLAQMKAGAVFYNIGRGATVDQNALLVALRSGHIAAAWLDVTDPEPLSDDHPLRSAPTCFITPHVAGGHQDETQTIITHFLTNLRRYESNEALRNRVM